MRAGLPLAALWLAVLLPAIWAGPAAGEELPRPSLEGMEPAVARQLEERRRALDEILEEGLLAGESGEAEARARRIGEMGLLYLFHELRGSAEPFLARAASLDPDEVRWPYFLGYLLQAEGRLPEAAGALRRAAELAPGDPAVLLRLGQVESARGEIDAARGALERVLADGGEAAPAAHFELGRLAAAEGDSEAAVRHFEAVLAAAPEASKVYRPLALAYRRLGRVDEARAALSRQGAGDVPYGDPYLESLVGLSAGGSVHLINAGSALARGRVDEAVREYRLAAERDPGSAEAHRGLGEALARAGRVGEAVDSYRRALEIEPEAAAAHYDLGTLLLSRGDLSEAVAALERALALAPELREAWANLAAAHGRAGRFAEAARAQERWLELSESAPPGEREPARGRLALALARQGRSEEALAELRRWAAEVAAAGPRGSGHDALTPPLESGVGMGSNRGRPAVGVARALGEQGEWAAAGTALEIGAEALPEEAFTVLALAHFLATAPEPSLRRPERALELAGRIFEADSSLPNADVLIVALAAAGRFDDAIALQTEILDYYRQVSAPPQSIDRAEARLAAYRRGEVWPGDYSSP